MPYGSVKVDTIVGSNKTLTTDNVVTTSDSGTVTSAMIADGAVVNADINASAAIAHSKLASITAGSVLMGNATNVPTATALSGDVTISSSGVTAIGASKVTNTMLAGSIADSKLSQITTAGKVDGAAVTGTIPSAVYGNSSLFVGTTSVALNRSSANLALTGISSVTLPGSTSGSVQLTPAAAAGTGTVITFPATTGTVITTGDTGTVTNTMLAGSIANAKLANSTISGVALGSNLNNLTAGSFLTGSTFNGSAAVTFAVDATSANTASKVVARDASGNFSAGTVTAALSGNASTATTLQTARTIQGVSFDGSANITVVTAGTGISVSGTAVTNTGVTSVNGSTGAVSNVATTNSAQTFTAAQRGTVSALSDGATITPDFSVANNFSVTLGGNRTLANPTNITAGQSGVIVISQDGTGSRTLSFGSNWKFPNGTAPTLTTTASKVDVLAYYCESASRISAQLLNNLGG